MRRTANLRIRRARAAGWVVALVIGFTATYPLNDYQLFQLSRVTTTALAVGSLILLTGHAGQVSAGQGALVGLGAYAGAILASSHGWPWPAAVLATTGITFVAGLLLGLPNLRLGGLSLALVTLSVAVVFPLVAARWQGLTGGPSGLAVEPVYPPVGVRLSGAQFLYLVTLAALAGSFALAAWWTRGRTGRALAALRVSPMMARANGVDTASLTVLVVAAAAAMAGLGGALGALVQQSAIPDSFTVALSFAIFTGAVIGGVRSWAGAVIGAAYIVYLPQLSSDLVGTTAAGQWSQVAYAATLLLTVRFAPNGIVGLLAGALRLRPARTTQNGDAP